MSSVSLLATPNCEAFAQFSRSDSSRDSPARDSARDSRDSFCRFCALRELLFGSRYLERSALSESLSKKCAALKKCRDSLYSLLILNKLLFVGHLGYIQSRHHSSYSTQYPVYCSTAIELFRSRTFSGPSSRISWNPALWSECGSACSHLSPEPSCHGLRRSHPEPTGAAWPHCSCGR